MIRPAHLNWKDNGTPESTDFGDIYFNSEDGQAETHFVFIKGTNAPEHWSQHQQTVIAETGFGTGLNFLCTWQEFLKSAPKNHRLHFISFEGFPLDHDSLKRAHQAFPELAPFAAQLQAQYPFPAPGFHRLEFEGGRIELTLMLGMAQDMLSQLKASVDLWYLDGFAPSKNPDMWSEKLFNEITRLSHDGTRLATFTAAGLVKRGLEANGWQVQKTSGYGRKRERITATLTRPSHEIPQTRPNNIAIIGAGIAGCALAHQLRQAGYNDITLIDAQGIAAGASGNAIGLINPKLSLGIDPYSHFMAAAFLYAQNFYEALAADHPDLFIETPASIRYPAQPTEVVQFKKLIKAPLWFHHHMQITEEAISLNRPISIRPIDMCHYLAGDSRLITASIDHVERCEGGWALKDAFGQLITHASSVIIASGHQGQKLSSKLGMDHIDTRPSRGQVSTIAHDPSLPEGARFNSHYLTPCYRDDRGQEQRLIGASFDFDSDPDDPNSYQFNADDHEAALNALETIIGPLQNRTATSHRTSYRAMMKDHIPVCGPAYDTALFTRDLPKAPEAPDMFKKLPACHLSGLYLCYGLGSRGLMTAPLLAKQLSDMILGQPQPLSDKVQRALTPARFLIKKIVRTTPAD